MELREYLQARIEEVNEFEYQYLTRRPRGQAQTKFRSEEDWDELFKEFLTSRRECTQSSV